MTEPISLMSPSTAVPSEANKSSAAPKAQTSLTTQPESTLQHIAQGPARAEKDVVSGFWTAYERVAKQYDDEFIERENGGLDSLLIFAGLFSSVSATFIVNMKSSLSPQPSDTTNALLKLLINKIDNSTFSEQEASLPMWTGPGSTIVWIQSLVYTSLSMSLLAAFGGVLGKQWLSHFKTSRFGQGTLHERCIRRQRKLDGLKTWHFNIIISTLPILLQLSLMFFGVALAANIWTLQHTVASVIVGSTSFGVIFYFFTVVASSKSRDCPFQTPVSTLLSHVLHAFRKRIMVWAHRARPVSWVSLPSRLQEFFRGSFISAMHMIARSMAHFLAYLRRLSLALWRRTRSPTGDSESAGGSDESASFTQIHLEGLESTADPAGARSIEWIIETSTDMDIVNTAVQMVPEVEWPYKCDVTFMLDQLKIQIYEHFEAPWQLTTHTRERMCICLKAIFHLYTERGLHGPLSIYHHNLLDNNDLFDAMPAEQDFYLISSVIDRPYDLDITSLLFSDRMWMAHILTYRLHDGHESTTITFAHNFIDKCLHDPKSPPRLVADCLVLAGLMVGLRPHWRYLAIIDKSAAIRNIQGRVIDRILHLLLSGTTGSPRGYAVEARKLLLPLAYSKHGQFYNMYQRSIRCLKLCFYLLEDPSTDRDHVQFTNVSAALRLSFSYSAVVEEQNLWSFLYRKGSRGGMYYWGRPPTWHTQARFDMLVDHLVQACQGTDYTTICDVFAALAGLRGSPSTLERKRLYIRTMIQFMESEIPLRTRHAALSAAYAFREEVASMDRDDEPLRYLFSRALISVIRARDPASQHHVSTSVGYISFNQLSENNWQLSQCYLGLLCALSEDPKWHGHGHFKRCLEIADAILSHGTLGVNKQSYVHLTHVFAIVDALDEDHEFLRDVHTYRIWPLILEAWQKIFSIPFFYDPTAENWEELSSYDVIESLPSVAAYAQKYWQQWDNREETHRLIQLVKEVCDKLDEEKRRREQSVALVELEQENDTFRHREILRLSEGIWELMGFLLREVSR